MVSSSIYLIFKTEYFIIVHHRSSLDQLQAQPKRMINSTRFKKLVNFSSRDLPCEFLKLPAYESSSLIH